MQHAAHVTRALPVTLAPGQCQPGPGPAAMIHSVSSHAKDTRCHYDGTSYVCPPHPAAHTLLHGMHIKKERNHPCCLQPHTAWPLLHTQHGPAEHTHTSPQRSSPLLVGTLTSACWCSWQVIQTALAAGSAWLAAVRCCPSRACSRGPATLSHRCCHDALLLARHWTMACPLQHTAPCCCCCCWPSACLLVLLSSRSWPSWPPPRLA